MIAIDLRSVARPAADGPDAYAIPLADALLRIRPGLYTAWEGGHPPMGTELILDLAGRSSPGHAHPTAVALHDASGLAGLRGTARRFRLGWLAARAALILAPSNLVAEAAATHLRVPDSRLIGARPGLDPSLTRSSRAAAAAVRARLSLPERYFVVRGRIGPRKQLSVLTDAWARVGQRLGRDFGLVIAGPHGDAGPPSGPGIHSTGHVPTPLLAGLLSGATAYLNPSLVEGCPLGVMEAMSCGCPPVVGRGTALVEPMRGAGIMLDSRDWKQWARAMTVLAAGNGERARLSAECRRLAAGFSAEAAAAELSSSLEAVLGVRSDRRRAEPGAGLSR